MRMFESMGVATFLKFWVGLIVFGFIFCRDTNKAEEKSQTDYPKFPKPKYIKK